MPELAAAPRTANLAVGILLHWQSRPAKRTMLN